MNKSQTGIGV